jgi:hypothetical protein
MTVACLFFAFVTELLQNIVSREESFIVRF